MKHSEFVFIAAIILSAGNLSAQPFGRPKTILRRQLPPAVELDARSFSITATTNVVDPKAQTLAASFREMFRAKIQGDSRFVLTDSNPALRVAISITRFYVEAKDLPRPGRNAGSCRTHLGNLQGTFTITEAATGRPLASDTIAWKLRDGRTKYWLESEDKRQMAVTGPQEKLNVGSLWQSTAEEGGGGGGGASILHVPGLPGAKEPHPCDSPMTENQAVDVLTDAFLVDLIHLAVPYETTLEVPLEGGKFKKASEDIGGGRWENARQELDKMGEQPKPSDEAARTYLIGLAHEMTGYKLGKEIFDTHQKITKDTPAEESAKIQGEIRGLVTQAKRSFDDAASNFKKASELDKDKAYRDAERRADQSRNLYVRIGRYSELKPRSEEPPPPTGLSMNEIVNKCMQGSIQAIIVDSIKRAPLVTATFEEAGELAKCGDKQAAIYDALTKRWDEQKK